MTNYAAGKKPTYLRFVDICRIVKSSGDRVEDALPNGKFSCELFGYSHRIAIELLAEIRSERRPRRSLEEASIKVRNDSGDIFFFLWRPFPSSE